MGAKGDRIPDAGKRAKAAVVRANKMLGLVHESGAEFLRTELDTAFTFAQIAEGAVRSKRKRSLSKAREGYDALVHFRPKVKLTSEDAGEIDSAIARLRSTLRQLGESV
jgi:hypothetical protein